MNGLEVTPDRERKVRFSRPYYVYRLQLVAREGDDRFQNLKDLERCVAAWADSPAAPMKPAADETE